MAGSRRGCLVVAGVCTAGTNPQEVDVRYETICVLDWLPSPVMSLLYSRKMAV